MLTTSLSKCFQEETKSFLFDLSDILQNKFKLTDFSAKDILRCMGIKRTNANTLNSINVEGGVALYATYPLMNNHCNCNTSCAVDENTFDIRFQILNESIYGRVETNLNFGIYIYTVEPQ